MLQVFAAQASVWGADLPAATPVNPNEITQPLMDLMRETGLARSKLVYHYKQFREQQHCPLRTSLDGRRTELRARVEVDAVLADACQRAGEHPITKFKQSVKRCVDLLSKGSCKPDCVARLEQLVELVAAHTVDEF